MIAQRGVKTQGQVIEVPDEGMPGEVTVKLMAEEEFSDKMSFGFTIQSSEVHCIPKGDVFLEKKRTVFQENFSA